MANSYESIVEHFMPVTGAIDELDTAIQEQYPGVETSGLIIDRYVADRYRTSPSYIQDGEIVCRYSDTPEPSGLIEPLAVAPPSRETQAGTLREAYEMFLDMATHDGHAAVELKKILDASQQRDIEGPVAVRRPLHVFRLAPDDTEEHSSSPIVALPEIVDARVTQMIGEQVASALHAIDSLTDNPAVSEAIAGFRHLAYRLGRTVDTPSDPSQAPLGAYKEGIITAAQALSFLSEGIRDEAEFTEAVKLWRQHRSIETIARCMPRAILGPLAVHGAQPKGEFVREPGGEMLPDFKGALLESSKERKQQLLGRLGRIVTASSPGVTGGWGCLASNRVIGHTVDLALPASLRPN